ncbi:MAG: 2-phosphosulfolactate phosphatase [Verrucomicrobia bacterium]|nr:2-phosphosulfolactate phosphatase [Verrucomicrobiota bacterium]
MAVEITVSFTPVEFESLRHNDLSETCCVVFDVLRATSTIVTALANGAAGVKPVTEIAEALSLRRQHPDALLAGERQGLRISAALTDGIEFDLGNSPREYTPERVAGRNIIITTTNGTRALQACRMAQQVAVGSFLNLTATVRWAVQTQMKRLALVCAGTGEEAALEDTLAAGAFCDAMASVGLDSSLSDSAEIALRAYHHSQHDLATALSGASNARRLRANADLRTDVETCLRRDVHGLAAVLCPDGLIRTSA